MTAAQSRNYWPTYSAYVDALARVDDNFEWLSRYFAEHRQGDPKGGHLNILETIDGNIKDHVCSLDELGSPPRPGNTRIVVLSYDQVWSIDREVLDKIAMTLNLPPYFLWQHLSYEGNHCEDAWPENVWDRSPSRYGAATSKVQSIEIGLIPFFHMSGMIASSATPFAGAIGKVFKLGKSSIRL